MKERSQIDPITAQRLLNTWTGLRSGTLNVIADYEELANEIRAAPLTLTGLVDTSGLSETAISFAVAAGMGMNTSSGKALGFSPLARPIAETQSELFALFAKLFGALTGRAVELITEEEEIRTRMMDRVLQEPHKLEAATDAALDELRAFYNDNSIDTFRHAKKVGGLKLVTGGQRMVGPSALRAVRITGLYADTQLIPDPIYPFLSSRLHLNAEALQLAIALFQILQMRPLVDADLQVPAVIVFPSFEEALEERDAETKLGMERLIVRMVAPICDATIGSMEELAAYATRTGDRFAEKIVEHGLFVPPGADPAVRLTASQAAKDYFESLEGIRSSEMLATMRKFSLPQLLLTGVAERLRPHYHLLENATEFGAQPLLSQAVHWHYFEKCAHANAQELVRKEVLSEQSFQTLRAFQDDSLSWLATIPVETLAKLISNNEHRWFREELNKYSMQLASAGPINTDAMVREVNHGLASLVQRQQKAVNDIERKYAPKKAGVVVGGLAGLGVAATVTILPSLSPWLGVGLPGLAAMAAAGGAALAFGKEKAGEVVEKSQAERSMLGVLATARARV